MRNFVLTNDEGVVAEGVVFLNGKAVLMAIDGESVPEMLVMANAATDLEDAAEDNGHTVVWFDNLHRTMPMLDVKHARDATTGQFVTEDYAEEHPDTTVVEGG